MKLPETLVNLGVLGVLAVELTRRKTVQKKLKKI
jgi:hypothetical protein